MEINASALLARDEKNGVTVNSHCARPALLSILASPAPSVFSSLPAKTRKWSKECGTHDTCFSTPDRVSLFFQKAGCCVPDEGEISVMRS